jgi:predicted  nucleic acid-binding Zn-ribbon protein
MSFLDRMAKAVTEAVDRGKKEVDEFVRIQRINGEIGDVQKKIKEFQSQIQAIKVQIGEKAVEMMRAGELESPDLQAMMDQIAEIEKQIVEQQAVIAEKQAEIEKIKAESEAEKAAVAEAEAAAAAEAAPAAAEPAAGNFCAQCGAAVAEGAAFCAQCGAKQE